MKKRKKMKTKAKAKAKAKKRAKLITIELQFNLEQKAAIAEVAALASRSFEDVCIVMLAMGMYMHRSAVKTAQDELANETVGEAVPEPSPAQADLPASTGASDPAPAVAA